MRPSGIVRFGVKTIVLTVLFAGLSAGTAGAMPVPLDYATAPLSFTDKGTRLVVSTNAYRVVLDKDNGAILSLDDRGRGTQLLQGQGGCLWGARLAGDADYVGGCSFRRGGADRFSYRWNARRATLTLAYDAAGAGIDAEATLTAADSSFDLRLSLVDRRPGPALENVLFPADLRASCKVVRAGYAPNFLPGVRLEPAFFSRVGNNVNTYPSRWAFADYLALDLGDSHLSLSAVNPSPNPLAPVTLGFVHTDPAGGCGERVFCIVHAFETWIRSGERWTSPTVRVRVGATAQESILGYRRDSGIDAYPSLADKLGPRLAALARAPLIKADLRKGVPPFAEWEPDLARLPSPSLLHPVAYQPRGHDENDPDFLPPDLVFGTTADLRAAVEDAHAHGALVMPYLNASWWDTDSPTLEALPPPLRPADVAVQSAQGTPFVEHYAEHYGYVVSPYVPFVRDRVAALLDQWRTEVPTDCLFFDQIGARPWVRDFNPATPTPLAYEDGWLSLFAPYRDRCLMIEDGWDRLADTFVGFHGGLLLQHREQDEPNREWGAGNWEPYPLALWLFHDKVLLYQHDLFEGTMTTDPEALAWNLAFGFVLSYAWTPASLESSWLGLVGTLQRVLGPHYAGKPLAAYAELAPGVTDSRFGDLRVVANRSRTPYPLDGYGIAPDGFLARTPDVTAGAFVDTFDGAGLAAGTHYLVVERSSDALTVRQPLGEDTPIALAPPPSWHPGQALHGRAYGADGAELGDAGGELVAGRFRLEVRASLGGQKVAFYRIG